MQMLRRFATALVLGGVVTAAIGCNASAPQLSGREFLSVSVTDRGVARLLVPGTRIRLSFTDTTLGASAGCNSISGSYRIESGRLIFEGGGMTEMACDPDRMAQDEWLVERLGAKPAIRLTGDELALDDGSTIIRLMDRKVVEPDVALVGPTWTVESIITGDAVSSVPTGLSATLVFGADGTLTVDDGCNTGGATWKAVGAGIEVGALALTKKACDGPAAALESAVVGVLRAGTIAAAIDADVLTLQAGTNGLQLRAS